ncbi:putative ATPase with chaperone activity [Evansella vedderi]|uniref:ATPase with chaperone activity n=1 Tax=Evansella vedderi TaxID=38282 RepID=A0ABT9ZQV4_9BACI|nr:hypothetical protein [Evansella vedderi]MDQ0252833.1 putative ATPase with chaperone activity [Evansella vedderi]
MSAKITSIGLKSGGFQFEQLIAKHPLTSEQQHQLQCVSIKKGYSNRVQIKIIRLARTIADSKGEDRISNETLSEAFGLRQLHY